MRAVRKAHLWKEKVEKEQVQVKFQPVIILHPIIMMDSVIKFLILDLVNNVFTWSFGGENVFLVGSFNGWVERIPMKRNGNEFTLIHVFNSNLIKQALERGVHQYKFIVDNEWRFAPDQSTTSDNSGNINNLIDMTDYKSNFEVNEDPSK